MLKYFRSKKKLFSDIEELKRRISTLDNDITLRERKIYFTEKLELIKEYEGRIISESEKAADERELKMMEIVESKETKIKELELENINLRTGYRNFKEEVREHEMIVHDFNTNIQTALSTIKQLAGQFESMEYRMCRVSKRTDKKDVEMIEGGKG